jgi:hypothetical protein
MRRFVIPLMLVAACGGGAVAPATSTTAGSTPDGEFDWLWSDPDDIGVVTVIDAGAEPRILPEYTWQVGDSTDGTMVMELEMSVTMAGESTVTTTSVAFRLAVEVLEVIPEGYVVSNRITDIAVASPDPSMQQALEDTYAQMLDFPILSVFSPRGENLAIEANLAATGEAWAQLTSETYGSISAPLPTEPVGAGATWSVVSRVATGGIGVISSWTYRLVSWAGTTLVLEVSIDQEVDPETALPPGVEFALTGSGTGTLTLDLTRLLPESAAETTSQVTAVVTEGGRRETLEQQMWLSITVSS